MKSLKIISFLIGMILCSSQSITAQTATYSGVFGSVVADTVVVVNVPAGSPVIVVSQPDPSLSQPPVVLHDTVYVSAHSKIDTVYVEAAAPLPVVDPDADPDAADNEPHRTFVARKDTLSRDMMPADRLVVVRGDTISMILPEKNFGRYDRGLYNYLYIPRRSWGFGLTASYGSINSDDLQLLSILTDINLRVKMFSVHPSVSYFFKDNQSVGARFNFTRGNADLESLSLDFDEDMSFSLHDVSYHSHNYKMGLFYRYYVGLDTSGRFSVFNEVSLEGGRGVSRFKRYYNDELYDTRTVSRTGNLNFSPGVAVFIQDFVAFNVSFGIFGLHISDEHQTTNGADEGRRLSSGANFKFNIFNINFGLLVVI